MAGVQGDGGGLGLLVGDVAGLGDIQNGGGVDGVRVGMDKLLGLRCS